MNAAKKLMMAGGLDWTTLAPGEAVEGGYFAGRIAIGGSVYAVIVSPKSSGEASRAWSTSFVSVPGALSLSDGLSNTGAMIAAGAPAHPAAAFCGGLSINGFNDWYLPAKNELEIIYRYLKPTTDANNTGSGTNTSSVPTTGNYTTNNPAQTVSAIFREGGIEALAGDYFSSTEYNANAAWKQLMIPGEVYAAGTQTVLGGNKTTASPVRAIRRVLIG